MAITKYPGIRDTTQHSYYRTLDQMTKTMRLGDRLAWTQIAFPLAFLQSIPANVSGPFVSAGGKGRGGVTLDTDLEEIRPSQRKLSVFTNVWTAEAPSNGGHKPHIQLQNLHRFLHAAKAMTEN
jgi:hypothetical protein